MNTGARSSCLFEELGYGNEFDDAAARGELRIDFEAVAAHLAALERSAAKHRRWYSPGDLRGASARVCAERTPGPRARTFRSCSSRRGSVTMSTTTSTSTCGAARCRTWSELVLGGHAVTLDFADCAGLERITHDTFERQKLRSAKATAEKSRRFGERSAPSSARPAQLVRTGSSPKLATRRRSPRAAVRGTCRDARDQSRAIWLCGVRGRC